MVLKLGDVVLFWWLFLSLTNDDSPAPRKKKKKKDCLTQREGWNTDQIQLNESLAYVKSPRYHTFAVRETRTPLPAVKRMPAVRRVPSIASYIKEVNKLF